MLFPKPQIALLAFAIALTSSCNLEKEIELELPQYDSQLIVECYIEPGKPLSLLLTRSTGFFEPFSTDADQFLNEILVDDAQVQIEHGGQTYILQQGLYFDFETKKISNYQHPVLAPESYDQDFQLRITTADGKTATARTRLLPIVPIDSVVIDWAAADTLAMALTYLSDNPDQTNYYRRMLHESSLDSAAVQDFVVSDRIVENGRLAFGTGFMFTEGDTIFHTIFHIDRAYYEFLESVQNAVIAGTSPFGTPGKLISNIEGDAEAVGIFTGLSYDRVELVIQK